MIKVSVIVPVYNVELYLRECLDSIINQTLKEIEIICIDDCSSDNSYGILEEYSKKDNRIIIFRNQENMSAGPSRNIGIRVSQGEYITFVDSDDFLDKNYYELLYNTAKEYDSDIVNTSNILRYNNGEISYYYCNVHRFLTDDDKKKGLFIKFNSNITLENFLLDNKEMFTTNPVNKIYSRDFLIKNNLFFMENTKLGVSEDADFILRLLMHSPSISFNNNAIYYYRCTPNSSLNSARHNYLSGINSIEHMNNSIYYAKEYFKDMLNIVYVKAWHHPLYLFSILDEENKEKFYEYLHRFANTIYLDISFLFSSHEQNQYHEYILIRFNKTYNDYLLSKYIISNYNYKRDIDLLMKEVSYIKNNSSFIRLFGIQNLEDRLVIILFGIKVTFKKRAEQSRAEQSRAEQSRAEQSRAEQSSRIL